MRLNFMAVMTDEYRQINYKIIINNSKQRTTMKFRTMFSSLAIGLIFSACAIPQKPNPEFSSCANSCNKSQSSCMLDASSGEQVGMCKSKQTSCVTSCEAKYPRYLPR